MCSLSLSQMRNVLIALSLMFELLMRNFDVVDLARTFNGNESSLKLTELTKEHVESEIDYDNYIGGVESWAPLKSA